MPKSSNLYFTQNINTVYTDFFSSDKLSVISVSTNATGTGYVNGTVLFTSNTAVGATIPAAGGNTAQWTCTIVDGRVLGQPMITRMGDYTTAPTTVSNAPSANTAGSGATFNLKVEIMKDLYVANTNDAVVKALNITSLDTAARVVSLWVTGTDNQPTLLGAVNVPLSAGANGTAASVDLLGGTLIPSLPYDANGKRILPLKAGQKISVSVPAVTAGTQINVTGFIEEY